MTAIGATLLIVFELSREEEASEWAHSQSLLEVMLKSPYLDLDDVNDDWVKSMKAKRREDGLPY